MQKRPPKAKFLLLKIRIYNLNLVSFENPSKLRQRKKLKKKSNLMTARQSHAESLGTQLKRWTTTGR